MMISKEKEDYLFKLKAELLFRGKDEHEVNDIIEELRDHFELTEKNHDDVSDILNTPVKDYADQFSEYIILTRGLFKYLALFSAFMLAIFIIPNFFTEQLNVTIGFIINILFIFCITTILPFFLIRKGLVKYGEQRRVYIYAFIWGAVIFGFILLSTYLTKYYPIYHIITLTESKSVIIGLILLLIVMILCFILKQRLFTLVIFIVCLPDIIGWVVKMYSRSESQSIIVSLIVAIALLLILNIAFFISTFKKRKNKVKE
ncbi:lysylphosphatidylglycerol synthetase-like protein (DUF2156 family) [Staphylococcus hominis]